MQGWGAPGRGQEAQGHQGPSDAQGGVQEQPSKVQGWAAPGRGQEPQGHQRPSDAQGGRHETMGGGQQLQSEAQGGGHQRPSEAQGGRHEVMGQQLMSEAQGGGHLCETLTGVAGTRNQNRPLPAVEVGAQQPLI